MSPAKWHALVALVAITVAAVWPLTRALTPADVIQARLGAAVLAAVACALLGVVRGARPGLLMAVGIASAAAGVVLLVAHFNALAACVADYDGRPVIVDFGLAKDLGVNSTLTAAGRLIATPRYMSPEQCQGLPVDPRSDIYSLGVILWEMFTGTRIYEEATPAELITMHVSAPPPTLPSSLAHHQPLLERMLAKKPEDRFRRAADVAAAINP